MSHKRKQNPFNFGTYVFRVLKQVHPGMSISNKGMLIMNDLIKDCFTRIVTEAEFITTISKKSTLDARAVQTATRLALTGEMAKHAISEGTKAVVKANTTKRGSLSKRAGLQFPAARMKRLIKEHWRARVGQSSAVYLAAVLEYICAEILELAGNAARDEKKLRILPKHITCAIRHDEELDTMFTHVIIAGGGVIPAIHKALIPAGGFGQAPVPAFGGFGQAPAPAFGGFGQAPAPAFGGFGQAPPATGGFSFSQAAPAFSGFGQAPAPAFSGFGQAPTTGFAFGK
eukprot:TRINITY_DN268_c0_g1_i2.p1 TRINITY_DN268_c0_g1~~TRINITY_DN268_c0_g1_i2.p1  ORF type:complete len:286 (+),score=58.36 TRINITY_DN268_c0_g1_i2:28-885(+)